MFKNRFGGFLTLVGVLLVAAECSQAQEYLSGMKWPEPPIVKPGKTDADPPADAIILFNGKDLSAWEGGDKWKIEDGVAIVHGGDIKTKQSFGDCQLHIEWSAPVPATGSSQGRGNSGVFLMDRYELQILDSYDNKTYFDGQASAIYKQTPPMVNAMRPPGEWNTYDIIWNAPKFKDDGSLESPAYITVLHNGVLTLNHFALEGHTLFTEVPRYDKHGKLPIHLQDHGNPVRFRNIWLREFKPIVGERERGPYFHDGATGKDTPAKKTSTSIQGVIKINGKPLDDARISFQSDPPSLSRRAPVKDGKYEVADVKPGRYEVSVRSGKGVTDDERVPEKYRSAEQSGLVVNVRDGKNVLDFELQK